MHSMTFGSLILFSTLQAASSATATSLLTPLQMATSLTQSSSSSATPTYEPGAPPAPKIGSLNTPDDGWEHGHVQIYNWCSYDVYFVSVGAHYLGGYRNGSAIGWGTPEDAIYHIIPSGTHYTEPFRTSAGCPYAGAPPYCTTEDKLAGQAVSIKIARSNDPADQNITQLEYALYQNPNTHDTFKRLYFDVSLLDCGAPDVAITDFNATDAMLAKKRELCPGYKGGVAVSFSADEEGKMCPPVYCDGERKCFMVYTFDRTRRQESSFTCDKEYRGNLILDLCVKEGDDRVQGVVEKFSSWAQTATQEALMLQMNKTAPPVLRAVTLETRTTTVIHATKPCNVKTVASSSTAA